MRRSELSALAPNELVDRFLPPLVVAAFIFVVLTVGGVDVGGLVASISPVWVAIVVFGYLGYRLVRAVERVADTSAR